jgi:hypothetical protein
MVRGAQKVMSHRMFGVISLFADHLLKLEISGVSVKLDFCKRLYQFIVKIYQSAQLV